MTAHQMVRGRVLLPVHWGTFNLALHTWTEPVERLVIAARKVGVTLALPKPAGSVSSSVPPPTKRWWPNLPWQTAEEAPLVSSKLGGSAL